MAKEAKDDTHAHYDWCTTEWYDGPLASIALVPLEETRRDKETPMVEVMTKLTWADTNNDRHMRFTRDDIQRMLDLIEGRPIQGVFDRSPRLYAGHADRNNPPAISAPAPAPPLSSKAIEGNAWICGFATALSEIHRRQRCSTVVCEVARAAGVTLARARDAGLEDYDLGEIRRAGLT